MITLTPATDRLAALVRAVPDDGLAGPTPCPEYTVGNLLDHIAGFCLAFTAAARKEPLTGEGMVLPDDWRTAIPAALDALAAAWQEPDAWTGMTAAGGVDLPGEVAGLVALDEVVVHGWDLAVATGQPYACDEPQLEAVRGFVASFEAPPEAEGGLFGPPVAVPDDAPLLDRVIGLTGRDPGWSAG